MPEHVVSGSWSFFDYIVRESANFETDRVLRDGDTIRAGDRTLRAVFRPGHSTTDTLFVDELSRDAFVGDHLLATITSGAELVPTELPGDERRRALFEYLSNLRKTGAMDLATCYSGHGPTIDNHRTLIDERMAFHTERLDLISQYVEEGCATAFDIAQTAVVGGGRGDADRPRDLGGRRAPRHPRQPRNGDRAGRRQRSPLLPAERRGRRRRG